MKQSDSTTNLRHILTDDEKSFLTHHKLSIDDVFDARGLSILNAIKNAKEQGKILIIGGQCRAAGHRLRVRTSTPPCAQCHPEKIAYLMRNSQSGYVYIAGSKSKKLTKVGGTSDIYEREKSLLVKGYNVVDDWTILYWVKIENYGDVEGKTHSKLKQHQEKIPYKKGSVSQDAREIFQCSFSEAKAALDEALVGKNVGDKKMLVTDIRAYDW